MSVHKQHNCMIYLKSPEQRMPCIGPDTPLPQHPLRPQGYDYGGYGGSGYRRRKGKAKRRGKRDYGGGGGGHGGGGGGHGGEWAWATSDDNGIVILF